MAGFAASVVLCDIQMPGEHDGVWLTNEPRRRYPSTAVILVTSNESVPPATSLRDGVVAYIVKPFVWKRALGAIKRAALWHEHATTVGPRAEAGPVVDAWLEELERDSGT